MKPSVYNVGDVVKSDFGRTIRVIVGYVGEFAMLTSLDGKHASSILTDHLHRYWSVMHE